MTTEAATVSFDDERLMLVDSNDVIIGYETKLTAHLGAGQLHRAFSVFIQTQPAVAWLLGKLLL